MIHKSKLMLPILAAIVGVAASAFTTIKSSSKANKLSDTWYQYDGPAPQTAQARKTASNYERISGTPLCSGSDNECAVELDQNFGDTPDFTNVEFDSNGIPIVDQNTDCIGNKEKN